MKTRSILIIVAAIAILGAIVGVRQAMVKTYMAKMGANRPPPPTVSTTAAKAETWSDSLGAVATLRSFQGVTVTSELAGTVRTVAFSSGAAVKAGDLLVELDTSAEEAQLESLEAAASLAATNLQRARELREKSTNTQADLDLAEASFKQSAAAVKQMQATIAKKRIVAPFDGRLGIRQVDIGQYLSPGTAVVMLEAIHSLYADFGLPQQDVARIQPGMTVSLRVDAFPDRAFEGRIEAVNPRISDDTRNVRVRATIPNPEELLRPGMFGNVRVELSAQHDFVVLPATTVMYSTYGDYVFVIDKQSGNPVAQQKFVTVGAKRGDFVAISKGLQAGEEVVTVGQMKLRNNVPVRIDNQHTLQPSATPRPTES